MALPRYTYIHTYIHGIHTYRHTYIHTYIAYTHTYIHSFIRTYIIHTYIHTLPPTNLHTYIHTQTAAYLDDLAVSNLVRLLDRCLAISPDIRPTLAEAGIVPYLLTASLDAQVGR